MAIFEIKNVLKLLLDILEFMQMLPVYNFICVNVVNS